MQEDLRQTSSGTGSDFRVPSRSTGGGSRVPREAYPRDTRAVVGCLQQELRAFLSPSLGRAGVERWIELDQVWKDVALRVRKWTEQSPPSPVHRTRPGSDLRESVPVDSDEAVSIQ